MSRDRARTVADAWVKEGQDPEHHRAQQEQLRRDWPTLADAIERLVWGDCRG